MSGSITPQDRDSLFVQIHRLVHARLEGTASDEEDFALRGLVRQNAAARSLYVGYMIDSLAMGRNGVKAALLEADAVSSPDRATTHGTLPSRKSPPSPIAAARSRRHYYSLSVVAGVVTVVVMLSFMAYFRMAPRSYSIDPEATELAQGKDAAPVIAHLTGAFDCQWGSVELQKDSPLCLNQSLELREGIAEITFRSGAIVVLEGPAKFSPTGFNGGRLSRGLLAADVPRRATGFTVNTPTTSIVDLGTQFGVKVSESGETDVHVFTGQIVLSPVGEKTPAERRAVVLAGEGKRISHAGGTATAIPGDAHPFAQALEMLAKRTPSDPTRSERFAIPLGNLFDDAKETPLETALQTDLFRAVPTADSLGVERVFYGGPPIQRISPSVRFDLGALLWQDSFHGEISNDSYVSDDEVRGGIGTRGVKMDDAGAKAEEGIGAHSNCAITFDLNEIRAAGQLPGKPFTFISDRAGINDNTFGEFRPSVYMAAIVSSEEGISTVFVNGRKVRLRRQEDVWSVADSIGPPLRADGQFVQFRVPVPANARYLTLVTSSAGDRMDYDRAVWSGARLEVAE